MDENGRETEWETVRWRVRTKCEGKGRRYQGGIKKKKKVETISEGLRMRSGDRCGNREKGREPGILCGAGLALTCSYDRTQEDFNACGP